MEQSFTPNSDAVAIAKALPLDANERDALLLDMHGRLSYIQAKVEVLPDHEERIRSVERKVWGVPGSIVAAVLAFAGFHFQ